jgi:hypothetical protein
LKCNTIQHHVPATFSFCIEMNCDGNKQHMSVLKCTTKANDTRASPPGRMARLCPLVSLPGSAVHQKHFFCRAHESSSKLGDHVTHGQAGVVFVSENPAINNCVGAAPGGTYL